MLRSAGLLGLLLGAPSGALVTSVLAILLGLDLVLGLSQTETVLLVPSCWC